MKRFLTILAAILLTVLCGIIYAQKNKAENDYNLKKAYEFLDEEKDEAKALDLVNNLDDKKYAVRGLPGPKPLCKNT